MDIPEELLPYRSVFDGLELAQLVMEPAPADGPLPPLATKLGGLPDLPPGMPWPAGAGGEPLQFGFQLNLTVLAERFPGLLPWPAGGGLLQFFISYDDPRAVVQRDLEVLQPAQAATGLLTEYRLEPVPGVFLGNDLPDSIDDAIRALRDRFTPAEEAALDKWVWADGAPVHKIGGSAFWIQDPELWTAGLVERGIDPWQYASDMRRYFGEKEKAYADGWRVVFQFGSMSDDDYVFGDGGVFYFVAPYDTDRGWDLDRMQVRYQSH